MDVNLACNVAWRSELLQFVPGLGPRKAGALLAALTRNRNKAESRSMLYKDLGVMGKVVFRWGPAHAACCAQRPMVQLLDGWAQSACCEASFGRHRMQIDHVPA